MISRVQMRHAMKTSISSVILLTLFALCAHGGEVERFIRETLEEQRARNATESSEVGKIIDDAIKGQKMPELELPKESVFTSKDKERDARYYKYDKTGKLISVEYAAKPEKNEYYAYDRQGNIIEKRMGDKVYKYTYDTGNQLKEMESPEGKREYFYDRAGRLVSEKLNGEIDVEYKYGYLDKVIEVNRNGKTTKFAYDGFGMLAQKTFHDGKTEDWVWDGMALVMRGNDIYVNEPHVSGGTPLLTKTDKGVRYHTSDFLGTTLWSTDTRGKALDSYADTSVFGEGSIQQDRAARFTGKPYDEDLQAYVFPYRNYDPKLARWTSSDPSGFPDGINQHFYACNPTMAIDPWGLAKLVDTVCSPKSDPITRTYQDTTAFGTVNVTYTHTLGWTSGETVTFTDNTKFEISLTAQQTHNLSISLNGSVTILPFNWSVSYTREETANAAFKFSPTPPYATPKDENGNTNYYWELTYYVGTTQLTWVNSLGVSGTEFSGYRPSFATVWKLYEM